jgi:hypothetical protein
MPRLNFSLYDIVPILVLNINGSLVQIASSPPAATTTTAVAQPAVTSPTQTVVPQTIATASGNQLTMANGNLVMVRNASDVRNIINNT